MTAPTTEPFVRGTVDQTAPPPESLIAGGARAEMLFGQQSRNEGPRVGLMAWRSRETARLPIGFLALQSRGTARLPVGARRPCTGLGGLPALQGPQGLDSLTGSAGTCRPGRDCNPCRAGRGSPPSDLCEAGRHLWSLAINQSGIKP